MTRYMYGISFVPADLEIAIRDAKGGNIRPSIPAVLRVCFSYDPQSHAYVFNLMRVVGTVTLLVGGGFVLFLVLTRKSHARIRGKIYSI